VLRGLVPLVSIGYDRLIHLIHYFSLATLNLKVFFSFLSSLSAVAIMSSSSVNTDDLSDYTSQKEALVRTPLLNVLSGGMDDTQYDFDLVHHHQDKGFASCVMWIVLSALLFLQFGMALCFSPLTVTTGLSRSVVNYSIFFFVVTTHLFRQSIRDCDLTNSAVLMLPEILMDIILGLVLLDKVVAAFLLMLVSTLVMAVFVVVRVLTSWTLAPTCNMVVQGEAQANSMFPCSFRADA